MAPESEHLARLPFQFLCSHSLSLSPKSTVGPSGESGSAQLRLVCVYVSQQWMIIGRDAVNVFRTIWENMAE